jgi:hypothetical protein
MKKYLLTGTVLILLLISCEKIFNNSSDDYFFKSDALEYKYSDCEFYDSSTHIIYLRTTHPQIITEKSSVFSVLANGKEIYKGSFWPPYSSSLPFGPYISSYTSFYPDFTLRIEQMTFDNQPADRRNDPRIISALEAHGLLHSGLSAAINSIDITGTQLTFKFTVTNADITDLLILDLEKTGPGLFHYFTNGLSIRNVNHEEVFSSQIQPETPSPWNSWKPEWLSVLQSGASRQFTINYSMSSPLNPGEYTASFEFPGLSLGITHDQLFQSNGRIWIGDVSVNKKITVQ